MDERTVTRSFISIVMIAGAIAGSPAARSDDPAAAGDLFVARGQQRSALMTAASARSVARIRPLSPADWQDAIDAYWGPGLPTERKLEIFDRFWIMVDRSMATFQGIEDVDWDALRDRYRPEVAAGVSRGRFAAIMNQLSLALRESHTQAMDMDVNFFTVPLPGVPLFAIGPWFPSSFGACATAHSDGTALIIDVAPEHPLGIERGDRVLGFDGRPWSELYPELLAAEPFFPLWWGSSPSSYEHTFVASAPLNWHLFKTVDVAKFRTGIVEHLPTAPLVDGPVSSMCTEQMDVPGIPKPPLLDDFNDVVSWGVLPGTRIGYIYVWAWFGNAGPAFAQAVRELTQEQKSDGLIIDFRFNLGGDLFLSNEGLGMLFKEATPTVGFGKRADPADHFKMTLATPPTWYIIDAGRFNDHDPAAYDGPIAVLTGPGALSSGDQVALRMTYHPNVHTFGKSTATAFNGPITLELHPDWSAAVAVTDAHRVGNRQDFLTHDEFVVDEPVWLTPGDVAEGKDTVVEAALRWIAEQ